MSREIKFRAWDIEEKKWFEAIYEAYRGKLLDLSISLSGRLIRRTIKFAAEDASLFEGRYILSQFTGLYDRYGKELYEGDIIQVFRSKQKFKSDICFIKYSENSFIMAKNKTDKKIDCPWFYDFEIIGNIYENKNLLKLK